MSARLAARLGRACPPPVACFGAGGGGGMVADARLRVGLVDGAGGGTLRPVAGLATGGLGAPVTPPKISS